MTALRQAAQAALEALELHATQYPHMAKGYTSDAAEALRAALAEPQPEPVAWQWRAADGEWLPASQGWADKCTVHGFEGRALYAEPQAQQPLTDEQIAKVICQATGWTGPHSVFFNLVRAIERAHGIGAKP